MTFYYTLKDLKLHMITYTFIKLKKKKSRRVLFCILIFCSSFNALIIIIIILTRWRIWIVYQQIRIARQTPLPLNPRRYRQNYTTSTTAMGIRSFVNQ